MPRPVTPVQHLTLPLADVADHVRESTGTYSLVVQVAAPAPFDAVDFARELAGHGLPLHVAFDLVATETTAETATGAVRVYVRSNPHKTSPAAQLERALRYAASLGLTVTHIYIDSRSGYRAVCPARDALLADLAEDDTVLAENSITLTGRDMAAGVAVWKTLKDSGATVRTATQGDVTPSSPTQELVATLALWVAAEESALISERTKDAKKGRPQAA